MKNIGIEKMLATLSMIVLLLVSSAGLSYAEGDEKIGIHEKIGILVIAHGSPSDDWCVPVRGAVDEVDLPYPVELGFLEFVPNETINDAVERLDDANVTKIIALPLFISSHSSHIEEIEYVLGLRDEPPMISERVIIDGMEIDRSIIKKGEDYVIRRVPLGAEGGEEEPLVPVTTDAEIVLTDAMDDHWLVAGIVADRTADLCANSGRETLVLVAHGTREEDNFAGWVKSTSSLVDQARLKLKYWRDPAVRLGGTEIAFIHHNETLHPEFTLRPIVENATDPVVVPLMVSEGYFTRRKIPSLLENLSYAYDGRALTPHPNVADWIEISASEEFTDLTLQIYDERGELLNISLDDLGSAHGHICPCVAAAFKASQRAFLKWERVRGRAPARGDLEIISAHPSDGHIETFEYILNSSNDVTVELPEGTDLMNLTVENYNYRFIEKSSGDMVVVSVKEGLFPVGFFEMRKRCKRGVATPDERLAFKLAKEELKDKILYLPADEVFEVEYIECGSTTTLTAEIIPAIAVAVPSASIDFGRVGAGMTSESQVITVVNTGASSARVSAMMLDDSKGFYNESLRLNGLNIGSFSSVVPSDTSDFRYEYEILANLVVPDWAGGTYNGTILFVAESDS
ncbi:CbiX [Candidatus Methanoperedenaceae archaeon GB50]|nr:CbiX [Candidatus Methanoperedenaceae archaeon GB37]CAD7776552.1 CbiX [Candidatus Methanoperedenaceae archaeon GB50]